MTLLAGEGRGRSYALEPAVRFLKVLGADADPNGLLHKVKSVAHLREMGAEPVDDSCILGETAYEIQPGFLAEVAALQAAAAAPAERVAVPAAGGSSSATVTATKHASPSRVAPARPPVAGAGRPLGGAPLPRELEKKRKEAEALARFLLENLS
jgi:hypothetical protein